MKALTAAELVDTYLFLSGWKLITTARIHSSFLSFCFGCFAATYKTPSLVRIFFSCTQKERNQHTEVPGGIMSLPDIVRKSLVIG